MRLLFESRRVFRYDGCSIVSTTIFLVDDHPAVRKGIAAMLEGAEYAVCGEAENCAEARAFLETKGADLALLDLSLGAENGLDLLPLLHARACPVIVYSMHESANRIKAAFDSGAEGYVCKREISGVLIEAVQTVFSGRRYLSPLASQCLALDTIGAAPAAEPELSERERQVFELLGLGYSRNDIALELRVGVRTVETYFARIMEKRRLGGMNELRRVAAGYRRK